MNAIKHSSPENNMYSFEYLSCFDKPFGLSLRRHGNYYEALFHLYLKLVQIYRIKNYHLDDIFFGNYADDVKWIVKEKLHLKIVKEKLPPNKFHNKLESIIAEKGPVLATINLKGLYYAAHYRETDERYFLIINGFNKEKETYSIFDSTHNDINATHKGTHYNTFILPYSEVKNIYDSYENRYGNSYVCYTEKNNDSDNIHLIINAFLDCIAMYIDQKEDQAHREIEYIALIEKHIKTGAKIPLSGENYEPASQIDFLLKIIVNYKYVFFNELIKMAKLFGSKICDGHKPLFEASLINQYESLVKALIDKWSKLTTHCCIRYHTKKKLQINKEIEEILKIEAFVSTIIKKIREKILSIGLDDVIFLETSPFNAKTSIDNRFESTCKNRGQCDSAYAPPVTNVEKDIAEMMKTILKWDDKVGIHHRFIDCGANSLNVVELISLVIKKYNVELPINLFFKNPSVLDVAKMITENKKNHRSIFKPIPKAPKSRNFPLSGAQSRLFIIDQFENNIAYNVSIEMALVKNIDKKKVIHAFQKIVDRHEALRTYFAIEDNIPKQFIQDKLDFHLDNIDIAKKDIPEFKKRFVKPFDLSTPPLFRAALLNIKRSDKAILLFDVHHIVADGASIGVILKEFKAIYEGREIEDEPVQYKDYTAWYESLQRNNTFKKQEEYWINNFSMIDYDTSTLLNLPTDFSRPRVQSYEGETIKLNLDSWLTAALKQFAIKQKISLYMLLFAAFNILLGKYTGQKDIVVGSPIAARPHADLFDSVGMFVNMMPIMNRLENENRFIDFLDKVKKSAIDAYENQNCPFENLVNKLGLVGNYSSNPLFNVVFVMLNIDFNNFYLENNLVKPKQIKNKISKFDLMLEAAESEDRIELVFEYSTRLFKSSTIEQMAQHYNTLLKSIIQNPFAHIKDLEIFSSKEKKRILKQFNDTKKEYQETKLIHQLFEEKAASQPDSTAVCYNNMQITYQALNEYANQLARTLKAQGVGKNTLVGIFIGRSLGMIAGILGILKSGGAYVPLEEYLPENRVRVIIDSLNLKFLIADTEENLNKLTPIVSDDLNISTIFCPFNIENKHKQQAVSKKLIELRQIQSYEKTNLLPKITSDDTAYIIFTSGSTGVPKGVEVAHKPVINLIEWVNNTFKINEKDKLLFVTSLSFDLSVYDVFGILGAGGSLRLANREEIREPEKLYDIMVNEDITFWDSAPAMLQQIAPFFKKEGSEKRKNRDLRLVFLSGDWIPITMPETVKRCFANAKFISLGGATEAVIWSNFFPVGNIKPEWKSIPYGKPIQNAKYYILDESLNPCPIGVPGDLYIGGECLAKGYKNDEALSSKKFIANPFCENERIYHTGDIAKYFSDGNIEFLGRKDGQVKIRGFRVELGEIETHLLNMDEIEKAVVIVDQSKNNESYLACYYVSKKEISRSLIKKRLQENIPDYMVPSFYMEIEDIVLTKNGKVDRNSLPKISNNVELDYSPPTNSTEKQIVAIWETLFDQNPIGIQDNFFDIGGHSLLAVQLISTINNKLGSNLSVSTIFQAPTIGLLSGRINGTAQASFEFNPLIKIKNNAKGKNIFFVHPGGGDVFCYTHLANELKSNMNFYGIKAYGLDDGTQALNSYKKMAEKYIDGILKIQKEGPFIIAGFCAGGTIAFEIAQKLKQINKEVSLVILVDSLASDFYLLPDNDIDYFMAFVRDFGGLANANLLIPYCDIQGIDKKAGYQSIVDNIKQYSKEKRFKLIHECARKSGAIGDGFSIDHLMRIADVHAGIYSGLCKYECRPYNDNVVLFKGNEEAKQEEKENFMWGWREEKTTSALSSSFKNEPRLGWDKYADNIDVETFRIGHFDFLSQPYVKKLAQRINYHINRALERKDTAQTV